MNFQKKSATVDGIKTIYWEKNHGQKNIIILLHGFPGTHTGLLGMANGIENYCLIIPDLPACGLSQPLAQKHNLENYSKWLESFLKELSISKAILVGHSFGSRLGLVFAGHHPEKVEKLVLITPVVKVEGLFARFVSAEYEIAKFLPQYLKRYLMTNALHREVERRIIFKTASQKKRQELMAREKKELKHLNPQINAELFDEFYKFSLIPTGGRVKTKTLVIAGALDEIAPLDSVKELTLQLADCEFVIMEKAGHLVVAEKPLTVAKIIKLWMKKD